MTALGGHSDIKISLYAVDVNLEISGKNGIVQ
jgi:hypothetical protein